MYLFIPSVLSFFIDVYVFNCSAVHYFYMYVARAFFISLCRYVCLYSFSYFFVYVLSSLFMYCCMYLFL